MGLLFAVAGAAMLSDGLFSARESSDTRHGEEAVGASVIAGGLALIGLAAYHLLYRIQRLATRAGARTGLWSSELDRLFVGWPLRDGHAAQIQVLGVP